MLKRDEKTLLAVMQFTNKTVLYAMAYDKEGPDEPPNMDMVKKALFEKPELLACLDAAGYQRLTRNLGVPVYQSRKMEVALKRLESLGLVKSRYKINEFKEYKKSMFHLKVMHKRNFSKLEKKPRTNQKFYFLTPDGMVEGERAQVFLEKFPLVQFPLNLKIKPFSKELRALGRGA